MTQDEVIDMARQAGLIVNSPYLMPHDYVLRGIEAFAKLVAEREREHIIAMEKDLAASPALFATMNEWNGYKHGIETFIAAIRARGEA